MNGDGSGAQRPGIPMIMGVLNVTPDSFSDGGQFDSVDTAVAHGLEMAAQGALVVDVGGESTRPGAVPVAPEVEIARVVPVIARLARELPDGVRISIDTRHADTARAAVEAGATLVNDVGASLDSVAAELGVGWVAMHMRGEPATMQDRPHYDDVVGEVTDELLAIAERARDRGVNEVWIDPGIGFGKTAEHNIALMAGLDALVATGWPVLIGVSRKRTMGLLTAASDQRGADWQGIPLDLNVDPSPIDARHDVSLTMGTWALEAGVSMLRVHDVAGAVHAATVVAGSF